jgi:hypothetical protein
MTTPYPRTLSGPAVLSPFQGDYHPIQLFEGDQVFWNSPPFGGNVRQLLG